MKEWRGVSKYWEKVPMSFMDVPEGKTKKKLNTHTMVKVANLKRCSYF